jgi:hypothetical protein
MRRRLEFTERIRAIFYGAKHFYPPRVGEGRRQFEERFDRLRSSPEHQPQCREDFPGSVFGRRCGEPVFNAELNSPAS